MFAVICGIVSKLIASTIPTILSVDTIAIAISAIIMYSMHLTCSPCDVAKVESKATLCISLYINVNIAITTTDSIARSHKSAYPIVRILPNRKDGRSGINPGVRKQQMMPMLIPKVQNTAIAESSLTLPLLDIHSTPNALNIENTIADNIGFIPSSTPSPIPPKEAWVMPPLMNTSRRVTMYVPIIPQTMLANIEPNNAFWKKV